MTWSKSNSLFQLSGDTVLIWFLSLLGAIAGIIVLLITIYLGKESWPVLQQFGVMVFFTADSWNPTENLYQIGPMLVGSVAVMIGALLVATPLGLLSALCCHFYANPKLVVPYRRLIEVLAGIPSVVYGFWGLVVLVPRLNQLEPPGASLLAGIIIVAMMILPTIALTADTSLANVPRSYLSAAMALGLNRLGIIRIAALPAAKSGIVTGIILAAGRAVGETMAVLMVCGNIVQLPTSLFDPVRTLTANIALEMAYAMDDHRAALFVSGLMLVILVIFMVLVTAWINREPSYDS